MSAPARCSRQTIDKFIDEARVSLRSQMSRVSRRNDYSNGDLIGRNHRLILQSGVRPSIAINDNQTIVTTPVGDEIMQNRQISEAVAKTLKIEAKHYLPKRLRYFALKYDFSYERIRLTYAKSRWGSCSSNGTISLNIALMKLPDELSDYVLLHELNHTRHMNHGHDFWADLTAIMPDARKRCHKLKAYSPYM